MEEEFIIIQIERHEARSTSAFTRWILPENAVFLYSNKGKQKTHWYEYYKVPANSQIIRIRRSNRGNIDKTVFPAKSLEVSEDMKQTLKLLNII
jgi:hypothetical protein